jgi:hypothetical protein
MDNRQQFPNYDYSTLEVAQNQHPEHAQATHGYAQGGYPQQTYQTDPKLYAPQPYEGYNLPQVVDESYPEVTPPKPEVQNAPKGDYAAYGEHQGGVLAPQERRIWGLKRKTFFIVLGLVLLVVVGAVVGGAVGATAGKNSVKTGGTGDPGTGDDTGGGGGGGNGSSPGTVNNSPVLASSKLAAINWTDSSAVEYNAVFWQAKTDGLMMSLWDSKGKAWELVNITDKMVDVNIPGDPGATALKAKPGTALAAAVRGYPWTSSQFKGKAVGGDFTIALFYMNPVNNIVEIVSGDPRGASWGLGDLTSGQNDMKAAPDSQLSVWWSLCETNCSGTALLFYESTDQALKMANSSDWNTQSVILNIVSGSSLTATSCAPSWGQYGSSAQGLRVYYDASDVLSELMWNGYEKTWYYGTGSLIHPLLAGNSKLTPTYRNGDRHKTARRPTPNSSHRVLQPSSSGGRAY